MGKNILQTTNKRVRPLWLCPLIKKIFTLFIWLLLLPVTALAADMNTVYVGGVALAGSSDSIVYATTNESGEVVKDGANANNYNIKWDGSTLTLHDATIQKELYASDLPLSNIAGAAIGVINQSGDAGLTVQLEGNNKIEGVSTGIHVRSSGGNAALNITGNGTLVVNSNYLTIQVTSIGGNAALSIENAKVTATSFYSNVVTVQSGNSENSSASLTVDGGSLTATAPSNNVSGIRFVFGSGGSGSGTPNLTVSGNATVRANGSAGGITNNSSTGVQYGTGGKETGGIIWNGTEGTVYGNVTLQEDLEIGEGESLTLDDGANLSAGDHNVIVDGGTLDEKLKESLGDKVKYAPAITTTSLSDGTVGTAYSQTLAATGSEVIIWSVTSGSLPAGLSLSADGTISGKPTTDGTFTFTVTATNDSGSDSKDFTLKIDKPAFIPVTGLELNKSTLTLQEKGSYALTTTAKPDNATNKNVTWESSDTSIATVDANGTVTAISAGTATITVTAQDGSGVSTSCSVTVTHSMVHTPKKDATCTEDGNIEYWYCKNCDKYFSDENATEELSDVVIPATGHHYVNGYCTKCGHRDPDYRPDPISYYNIYIEDVCDGVEVSTSKNVVREGGSVSVYVKKDTANYTFDNFKVYYKRSYYGTWDELKEGTQPGEYPIKNIWTHIYIKAEGAEEKEDPTGTPNSRVA